MSLFYKRSDSKTEGSFKSCDTAWRFCERFRLFLSAVWGMISSNQIDGSIFESLNDLLSILLCTERRVHLGKCTVFQKGLFRQCEVMWSSFSVNVSTELLCCADKFYRISGTDMLDDNSSTASKSKHTVTGNHNFFSDCRRTNNTKLGRSFSGIDSVVCNE